MALPEEECQHSGRSMTWYFNNEGVADGPYEDDAMAALLKQNRIKAQTLVWHVGGESWQGISIQAPSWWQPTVATPTAVEATPSSRPLTRGLVPKAPQAEAKPQASGGFLKRLFGLGGKK